MGVAFGELRCGDLLHVAALADQSFDHRERHRGQEQERDEREHLHDDGAAEDSFHGVSGIEVARMLAAARARRMKPA